MRNNMLLLICVIGIVGCGTEITEREDCTCYDRYDGSTDCRCVTYEAVEREYDSPTAKLYEVDDDQVLVIYEDGSDQSVMIEE